MPELEIIPHPEQRRSYLELREEFRSENQRRIHSQLKSHPVGWGVIGDSEVARDRYTSEQWMYQLLKRLDDPVTQDFGLTIVRPYGKELDRLSDLMGKQAQAAIAHDSVTWDEGEDQDAPACREVSEMTDDELADYVQESIRG